MIKSKLSPRILILLCMRLKAGLCDRTTNINLCCPENHAHMKTEINEVLVRACTHHGGTDKEWEERVSEMKSELNELNSSHFTFIKNSEGLYKCPENELKPLETLIPGITARR